MPFGARVYVEGPGWCCRGGVGVFRGDIGGGGGGGADGVVLADDRLEEGGLALVYMGAGTTVQYIVCGLRAASLRKGLHRATGQGGDRLMSANWRACPRARARGPSGLCASPAVARRGHDEARAGLFRAAPSRISRRSDSDMKPPRAQTAFASSRRPTRLPWPASPRARKNCNANPPENARNRAGA